MKKIGIISCICLLFLFGCGNNNSQESTNVATSTDVSTDETTNATTSTSSTTQSTTTSTTQSTTTEKPPTTTEKPANTTSTTESKPPTTTSHSTTEAPKPPTTQAPTTQAPTTQASCSHVWVERTKVVHHDAVYETKTVTEYREERYTVAICNQCGIEIPNGDSTTHYVNSPTVYMNLGTDEEPWWTEVHTCSSCHTEGRTRKVPYETTTQVLVKDAWDETVGTGKYYCTICGKEK